MGTGFVSTAAPVSRLMEELQQLPGVGPKTAARLAYFLLRAPEAQARALAEAIVDIKEKIVLCSQCQNITESDPCPVCQNPARDHSRVCVVAEPLDILALERTGRYKGLYHVLHGLISPLEGIGPDQLKIKDLMARLNVGGVQELVLATNPNLEGDATAMYLHRMVTPLGLRVTRLARGLPVGGDLEYADEVTLGRALDGRQEM
ncbi:MAG: recombination mediator RecR [Dehalococcoidia bacterium]|nr:recombination mediator RecR [Dehalococcoidia bacterium]